MSNKEEILKKLKHWGEVYDTSVRPDTEGKKHFLRGVDSCIDIIENNVECTCTGCTNMFPESKPRRGFDSLTLTRISRFLDKVIQKMEQELLILYNQDLLPGTIDDMAKIIQVDLTRTRTEDALRLYRGFRELIWKEIIL